VNPTFSFSQGFESAIRALRGVGATADQGPTHSTNASQNNATPTHDSQTPENGSGNRRATPENRQETRPQRNPVEDARPFSFLKDFRGVTFEQIKANFSNENYGYGLAKTLLLCCFFTTIGAMNLMYECLVVLTNIVVVTGDVTIRGIHAVSRLVESLSPIFLGVLNFVGKIVTGLYILIAMLLGCAPYMPNQQKASPPRRPALMYR